MSALVKVPQKAFFNEKPLKVRLDQKGKVPEQDVTVVSAVLGLHGSQSQLKKIKGAAYEQRHLYNVPL